MNKKRIGLIITFLMCVASIIALASTVSAWSTNTFNNSLTTENLTISNQNTTRYLAVPSGSSFLTSGRFNISYGIGSIAEYKIETHGKAMSTLANGIYLKAGWKINTKVEDISVQNMTKKATCTATKCYLLNSTGATIISASFVGDICTFTPQLLANNTIYYMVADAEGIAYNAIYNDGATSFPFEGTWITYVGSYSGNSAGDPPTDGTNYLNIINIGFSKGVTQPSTNFTLYFGDSQILYSAIVLNSTETDFNTTITLNNLSNYVNSYLPTCSYVGGYCDVPFIFSIPNGTAKIGYSAISFSNEGFIENSQTYNASTYETSIESFILNITYDSSTYSAIIGNLVYNGTSYSVTKTGSGNNAMFIKSLDIPTINSQTNKTFYWNIGLTNSSGIFYYSTSNINQTINNITLGLCSATLNVPYVNLTFKDETTLLNINATIQTSTFEYYLGSGAITKSFIFSNSSVNNPSYDFCFSPSDKPLSLDLSFQYAFTGYPQRIYEPSILTLINITTSKVLYLLSSSDGIYTTFQVTNAAEQPLEGVAVNLTRIIGAETILIGNGLTGATGTITFWQNPDFIHTANFLLSPYPFYTVTQAFTSTEYTISLGGSSSSNVSDYTKGIIYSFKPATSYLENGTYYNFNFTISSSYWSFDSYGFNITNENGLLLGSASGSGATGSSVYLNITTGNNETFYISYYWIINGTTTSATRIYPILNTNRAFSIAHLISDLTSYITLGLFGLDNFGLGLISFFVILGVVGTVKLKGVSNEAVLVGLMFALVAFFDIGLNLFTDLIPSNAVPHLPSIVMGIIFLGFLIKEGVQ